MPAEQVTAVCLKEMAGKLKDEITEILFKEWDPIGFNNDPSFPKNQYESYAMPVAALAVRQCSEQEIADWLEVTAEHKMALETSPDKNASTAKQVIEAVERYPAITPSNIAPFAWEGVAF